MTWQVCLSATKQFKFFFLIAQLDPQLAPAGKVAFVFVTCSPPTLLGIAGDRLEFFAHL